MFIVLPHQQWLRECASMFLDAYISCLFPWQCHSVSRARMSLLYQRRSVTLELTFQNTNLMHNSFILQQYICYQGHLESKERFAIKKYLLIIGKKKNMQVLSHTFTYFSTQSPWTLRYLYRDTSLLIPSSYQKAAWPNVHKFCGIANVR